MLLVLFDIDGTLIDSGGAGVRALNYCFKELFAITDAFNGISMAGKTDSQIMKEGLAKHGISMDGHIERIISAYLRHLNNEINNNNKNVKPGIYELLESLDAIAEVKLGLLTGNLEAGARIKLSPFDLNRYFPSGAFGSDNEDRNKLLPIAVKRYQRLYGIKIGFNQCIVIGDTPLDVYCAKPYGALTVGVATGPYPIDALRHAGADHVFEDLSDSSSILKLLK